MMPIFLFYGNAQREKKAEVSGYCFEVSFLQYNITFETLIKQTRYLCIINQLFS